MVRLLLVLLSPAAAWSADWFVAADAAPGGTGSSSSPFATVNQGLNAAQPGDTVWLRGGTYRGPVWFPRSGTAGRPITLAAWSPDGSPERREAVTLTTAVRIAPGQDGAGAWEGLGGGLWRIALPTAYATSKGTLFVTLDDQPLQDARWPNTDRIPDFDKDRAAEASAGRVVADDVGGAATVDEGEYTVPALATAGFADGALAGARMRFNPGRQWGVTSGRVIANRGSTLGFTWNRNGQGIAGAGTLDPMPRDWLIVWDALVLLDRPDEHWLDTEGRSGPAGMLYLRSATPPAQRRLAVGRNTMAGLGGRSHITIAGIGLLGNSLWGDAASSDILIEGVTSRFAGAGIAGNGSGIQPSGRRWTIRDCDIEGTGGSGIYVADARDIRIEDVVASRVQHSGVLTRESATAVTVVAGTFWDAGGTGVSILSFESEFTRLHVYKAGRITSDIALINAFGSPGAPLRTSIHHNWVHAPVSSVDRTRYRWEGCNGIRTDSGGNGILGVSGVDIHHNLIWGEGMRNGIQIFALRPGQTGYGQAAIRIAHNTILASGAEAASINLIGDSERSYSARGIEVVNNLAGGYTLNTGLRDTNPPDLVDRNLFTNARGARGLPVVASTSAVRNIVLADPRLPAATVRDATPGADSPLVDAGLVHPLSGQVVGAAPDIGAVERGAPAWTAGARVGRRHVPGLRLRGTTAPDGRRYAVVEGLPPGRLLPSATTVDAGGVLLAGGEWAYDAHADRGLLRFALSAVEPVDGAVVRVDLDGPGGPTPPIALAATASGFAVRVAAARWDAATRTLVVDGSGFAGATEDRRPLQLVDPAGGDLRQRPVVYRVPAGAGGAGRLALLAEQGGDTAVMPASVDQVRDGVVQGWSVLPDAWAMAFGPAAAVRLWAADRDDGGPRPHAAADSPGSGTGDPEVVQWPVLGAPERLQRLAPERSVVESDGSVGAVGDPWSGISATAAGTRRPRWSAEGMGGLPALRYDGLQRLDHPGATGSGALAVVTVYRNQDPGGPLLGSRPHQRLIRTALTWSGAFLNILNASTAAALPVATPTLRGFQDAATVLRPRSPLFLGNNAPNDSQVDGLVGWMGEALVFASVPGGMAFTEGADYLATKYRVHPAGRIAPASGPVLPAARVRYAGRDLIPVRIREDRMEFTLPQGSPDLAPWGSVEIDLGPGRPAMGATVAVQGDLAAPRTPEAPSAGPAGSARPVISGSTEPLARVRILVDGAAATTVTADATGAWSWIPAAPFTPGTHRLTVDAEDASGNRSALSAETVHRVDAPPAVSTPAAAFPPQLVLP